MSTVCVSLILKVLFQTIMVKDYLGTDQRKVRHDDKAKDDKEIKVIFFKFCIKRILFNH